MGRLERMIATQPNGPDIAAKALRAMTGDADAAFFVSRYLTYGERLDWALDLFRFGALTAARRVVLDKWSLDHDGIVGDAARLRCFHGLITATRHLDRNIATLPETVTLWRGQKSAGSGCWLASATTTGAKNKRQFWTPPASSAGGLRRRWNPARQRRSLRSSGSRPGVGHPGGRLASRSCTHGWG